MKNTRFTRIKVDIATFIKAYAACEDLGGQYFEYCQKWQNAFNIVESYRLNNGDMQFFNSALAYAIAENGISHFEYQEEKYARKAYNMLLRMDTVYSQKYGKHFKSHVKCKTNKEIIEYLIKFDQAYNDYMAGGHIEFEDRI